MTMAVKSNWYGDEAKARAREGGARGIAKWALELLAASQPLVPVSPRTGGGMLRDSGRTQVDAAEMIAAVSYDGPGDKPSLPIWVHENLSMQHDTGQAKFLEEPLNASRPTGPATVAEEIHANLGV